MLDKNQDVMEELVFLVQLHFVKPVHQLKSVLNIHFVPILENLLMFKVLNAFLVIFQEELVTSVVLMMYAKFVKMDLNQVLMVVLVLNVIWKIASNVLKITNVSLVED